MTARDSQEIEVGVILEADADETTTNLSKYDHLSKEELIGMLHQRDASRKLGLVWERDPLLHENALSNDYVALELDSNLSVGHAPYENVLIEGDNFDALRYLQVTYKGRIKCIYIDPPYNTGNKDFIYNDTFLDKDDSYRHSKWLEFMYQRLMLAKDLLSEDGVIFVSIDDGESAHLTLLMDQVFPNKRVGTFVWRRRSGTSDTKGPFVSVDHEYVLCYANKDFTFAGTPKDAAAYTDTGDADGPWVSSDLNKAHNFFQRPDTYYAIHNPNTDIWYPGDPDRVSAFVTASRQGGKKIRTQTIEELIKKNKVLWPSSDETVRYDTLEQLQAAISAGTAPRGLHVYRRLDEVREMVAKGQAPERLLDYIEPMENWVGRTIGYGKPRYKRFWKELKRTEKPVSTWIMPASTKKAERAELDADEVTMFQVGYNSEGTKLLSQMVHGAGFQFPKPISLIKELVGQATDNESGHIVMDFFAGSGTTGHAVLALNEQDDGNRSFVLVSSTESTKKEPHKNVCRDVTARRLRAAIEGYSYRTPKGSVSVPGVGGQFAYMRVNRVPKETIALDIRHEHVWYMLQQLHANTVSPFAEANSVQILEGEGTGHDIVYVPMINEPAIEDLRAYFNASNSPCLVYAWQPGALRQRFHRTDVQIRKIPDYLIERFGGMSL